jgi:hypothetical protein
MPAEGDEPYSSPRFTFEPDALAAMVDYLKGSSGVIEPFQLQLLARHAELIAEQKGAAQTSVALTLADFEGGQSFSSVLENFYRDTLHKILPLSQRKKAQILAEEGLLGGSGHRLMLEERQILDDYGLTRQTLETLSQERLILRERRMESVFYEISHDRLAESIYGTRRNKLPRKWRRTLWAAAVTALVIVAALSFFSYRVQTARTRAEGLIGFLRNKVNSGAQQPTISLFWNQSYAALDGRTVRGPYGYYQVSKGVVRDGDVSSNNWSVWLQDSWTVKSNFTLNAGVRAENEHVPSFREEFPGIDYSMSEKVAPRVGFAYDIFGDSKWKAYGSYGKYFDITKLEMPRGSFGAEHWIQYFWTLDTLDWTSINCQEGPTGCPGTFIEQNDRRHPANEPDPALTSYFGREQNTIDPNLKPVQTGELTFGVDHELGRSMSVGVRYVHKWLDRTIEDVGILVPGVGEVFFIANPGEGVAEQILPVPAPKFPKAQRDYDGVEFRLIKRFSNRWSLNTSYTWSRLFGNYGGLASSDENGRTSPNVERYFDGQYLTVDKHGKAVYGLLPTDRPHYFKAQVTYDLPWGTNVGLFQQVSSGGPKSTTINLLGYNPTFINGRGDLGRLPTTSQTDMFLQHEFRLIGEHRVAVNLNIDNLFNQNGVLNENTAPWRDSFSVPSSIASSVTTPGVLSARDNYLLNIGYEPAELAAAMRAAGSRMRDNSLYGKPSSFQGRRALRVGVKYTF